jgi:6-phosphofructokinase 1
VVAYKNGIFTDFDIDEALAMQKEISEYQFQICRNLAI